jgi:hypothetical protein
MWNTLPHLVYKTKIEGVAHVCPWRNSPGFSMIPSLQCFLDKNFPSMVFSHLKQIGLLVEHGHDSKIAF